MDFLRDLGFLDGCCEMGSSCLKFNLDGQTVYAQEQVGLYLRWEVTITGVISTSRTLTMIECALPVEVESREQGLAWIGFALENLPDALSAPAWLIEGRAHRHTLPWERERAAYAARPNCRAERDWVRVAWKRLALALTGLNDGAKVHFAFDGLVMTIRPGDGVIAFPASGQAWPQSYSVPAGRLRGFLAQRLMQPSIEFSVWDGCLVVGNRRYNGAQPDSGVTHLTEAPQSTTC
jgi:hypothetical protein